MVVPLFSSTQLHDVSYLGRPVVADPVSLTVTVWPASTSTGPATAGCTPLADPVVVAVLPCVMLLPVMLSVAWSLATVRPAGKSFSSRTEFGEAHEAISTEPAVFMGTDEMT